MNNNFTIFINTILGKKIPIDTSKEIEKYYNLIKDKPICSFCISMDVNYYDYLDGVGYICPQCNIQMGY